MDSNIKSLNTKRIIHRSLLQASQRDFDVTDSSFFKIAGRTLPSTSDFDHLSGQQVVKFPDLNLAVKFGKRVTVDEAITMWAIRDLFKGQIPVPELYGWRVRQDCVFIYMELIDGITLADLFTKDRLDDEVKTSLQGQIKAMLHHLHRLSQQDSTTHGESGAFIGSITHGPLLDCFFYHCPAPVGPFATIEDFFAWMEGIAQATLQPSQKFKDPYLATLATHSTIQCCHADVHPTNIMVSKSDTPRVLALIDWGQGGWYPDWWEYIKMCHTTDWESEWRAQWFPKMIAVREDELYLMAEFIQGH